MFYVRLQKIWRDLWLNKTRTTLAVLSIAVGVLAIGTIATSRIVLVSELAASYAETNPAHAVIRGDFDRQVVKRVARMDGVAKAEQRGEQSVQLQVNSEAWRALRLTTILDYNNIQINNITPVSGAWPPGEGELLVERTSLEGTGAQLGDTVVIELGDGRQRTLHLTGLVHDIAAPPAFLESTLKGYITLDTQEALGYGRHTNQLHLLVEGEVVERSDVEPVAFSVLDKLKKGGNTDYWLSVPEPGKHWANDLIDSMIILLTGIGALLLISGAFLVLNTIEALLSQQVRQIGIMKAIGAQTGQLISMYLGLTLIFGLLSLAIAMPLSILFGQGFIVFTAKLLNFPPLNFYTPPQTLLLEVVMGLLVPVLGALWPIITTTRVTVRQTLSDSGLGNKPFGTHPIDSFLSKIRGLPNAILLSLRNTFRRKTRLSLTLGTLAMSGAIFIAVLSVRASLIATLDESLAYWNYDVDVYLSDTYRIDFLVGEALRVPGVVAAESWLSQGAHRVLEEKRLTPFIDVLALPAESTMIRPNLLAGRWLLPEDENGLVINSAVSEENPDIKVGDVIILDIEEQESAWQVVGVVQSLLTGPTAYANYPYFARHVGATGRASSVNIVTTQHDALSQLRMAAALTKHFESKGLKVASTETTANNRTYTINQFNVIVAFLSLIALLITIVGALALTSTMSTNVLERSREIGMMRAIGGSEQAIFHIFLAEGIVIGVLSWLLGTLLAYPISKLLSDTVGLLFLDTSLKYRFSTDGAILWLVIIMILATLSSWWPSRRASRITVREVLAYS